MKIALKAAVRQWGYYLVVMLISVLFIAGIEAGWLRILLGLAMALSLNVLVYGDCAYRGERAATASANLERYRSEGRTASPDMKAGLFDKKIGVWIAVFCLIPALLVSAINLGVGFHYPEAKLAAYQEELDAAEQAQQGDAFVLPTEVPQPEFTALENAAQTMNVVSRVTFIPYVALYDLTTRNIQNLLFLLCSFVMPAAAAVGYLNGPRLREKKLKDIAKGKKRKMKNLKVNKPPKRPKAEV